MLRFSGPKSWTNYVLVNHNGNFVQSVQSAPATNVHELVSTFSLIKQFTGICTV